MVIVEVDREDPFQVALVENDHVVQAIAPDTTDDPRRDVATGSAEP